MIYKDEDMFDSLRNDAKKIYEYAISESLPDAAVEKALSRLPEVSGRVVLVAIGKAAWQMAAKASLIVGDKIDSGVVITKYEHSKGKIDKLEIYEAAHPVPDENGIVATRRALELTQDLSENDLVIFLVSGGGSALFEDVECTLDELRDITTQLLRCGASIGEINTVRKHLSNVKGGRFAAHVAPARVFAVVLSDVLGNSLDMIASGPAAPDSTTVDDVNEIIKKYGLTVSEKLKVLLGRETPKSVVNAEHEISGSVSELCASAATMARKLGYDTMILTDELTAEAGEVGSFLGSLARYHSDSKKDIAFVVGGETVVHLKGKGLGGRNQEIALSAAEKISGVNNVCVFSVGSDGTDGPTDAAGGYADGRTKKIIEEQGKTLESYLSDNDSYHALSLSDGLIFTGATGTNVNDVAVVLIKNH